MKAIAATALLTSLLSLHTVPMMGSEPEVYPVRFHMMHVHYGRLNNASHGEGQANVIEEGQPTRAYDFTFGNCLPFKHGDFPRDLPGRWTGKEHYQLIVLRTDLGATLDAKNQEECILQGKPRDYKYIRVDGKLAAQPLAPIEPLPKQ